MKVNETYVVDGNNVCWWYAQAHPDQVSILPLLTVLIALLDHGDDFYCVFDATISHILTEQNRQAEAEAVEKLLREHSKHFYRVTGSTKADSAILHDADHNVRKIITNDTYRDYQDRHTWLRDKFSPRLIQGNLQPSGLLTLDKLPYGRLEIGKELRPLLTRLTELLEILAKKKSEIEECQSPEAEQIQEKELVDEQLCIQKADEALREFLEPYGTHLRFTGKNWKHAARALRIKFERDPMCPYCYYQSFCYRPGNVCPECHRGTLTNNPQKIWKIINTYSPKYPSSKSLVANIFTAVKIIFKVFNVFVKMCGVISRLLSTPTRKAKRNPILDLSDDDLSELFG